MKTMANSDNLVLLIEDFQIDIDATLPLLIDSGYQPANIHVSKNLDDAEQFLRKSRPELVILDLEIPQNEGTISNSEEALNRGLSFLSRLIKRFGNQLPIIAYSRYLYPWAVYRVISQGVSFIAKQDHNKEFFPIAINQVKQGHMIISSNVIPHLRQIFRLAVRIGLDDQDKQILQLISSGKSDREIASEMGYGEDWVANRLRRMFKAFGFRKRNELAVWFRDYVVPIYGLETIITNK